ncbi:hypothetical protein V6N13_081146 [Hibiscus sabdariffa]
MGGKMFLLTFEDEDLYIMLEDLEWSYLKEIFYKIEVWSETLKSPDHATWIEVRGLPLHGIGIQRFYGGPTDSGRSEENSGTYSIVDTSSESASVQEQVSPSGKEGNDVDEAPLMEQKMGMEDGEILELSGGKSKSHEGI